MARARTYMRARARITIPPERQSTVLASRCPVGGAGLAAGRGEETCILKSKSFVPTNIQSRYPSRIFLKKPQNKSPRPCVRVICRYFWGSAACARRSLPSLRVVAIAGRASGRLPAMPRPPAAPLFNASLMRWVSRPPRSRQHDPRAHLRRRHPRPNMMKRSTCEDAMAAPWPRAHHGVSLFLASVFPEMRIN